VLRSIFHSRLDGRTKSGAEGYMTTSYLGTLAMLAYKRNVGLSSYANLETLRITRCVKREPWDVISLVRTDRFWH
jgi:hypothetical protein